MQKSGVRFGSDTARVTVVFAAKDPLFEAPTPFLVHVTVQVTTASWRGDAHTRT